ncbi:emp24/gp25L/p24 family/GOLD protein [Clavispora lusitaniae]|uniref:emp24/gp25L/p24 family/GOLD protein n=1 Tax=Clavispora lusitaniae TaxID=36911 RepID=UPI00202C2830|nr:emp24/gp25L/p24 family/GOLD protein [Clavispora lusitaniae]
MAGHVDPSSAYKPQVSLYALMIFLSSVFLSTTMRAFFVATLLFCYVQALHFYLKTGEIRCFYEDLQVDTLVVGKIDAYDFDEQTNEYFKSNKLKVRITVDETFDNDDRVVDQASKPSGDFTFTSFASGEHKFCLSPIYTEKSPENKHRIFFDIAFGSADDYVDSKSSKKVDSLTLQVQNLNKKLQDIHSEQESIREREAAFRNQSESTNSRVVWWSIIQLLVLVGTCAYQLRHLKSFFVKQKIV